MKAKYFIEPDESGIFCGDDKLAWVDSRAVAECFEKSHTDVLDAIENLDCSVYFRKLNFELSEYAGVDGKYHPRYDMTREGFIRLTSRWTEGNAGQIRYDYIRRFNDVEALIADKMKQIYRGED